MRYIALIVATLVGVAFTAPVESSTGTVDSYRRVSYPKTVWPNHTDPGVETGYCKGNIEPPSPVLTLTFIIHWANHIVLQQIDCLGGCGVNGAVDQAAA